MASLLRLPEELLVMIIGQLDCQARVRLRAVCRRLQSIVDHNGGCWRNLDLGSLRNGVDDTILGQLVDRAAGGVDILAVHSSAVTDSGFLRALATGRLSRLRVLNLHESPRVSEHVIRQLIGAHTEEVALGDFGYTGGSRISSRLVSHLGTCRRLRRLRLMGVTAPSSEDLVHLKDLDSLELPLCQHMRGDDLAQICCASPRLRVLDVSRVPLVDDKMLLRVAETCHQLESFHCSWCSDVSEVGLVALVRVNPRLERVGFTQCRDISDGVGLALAKYCPELRVVHAGFTRMHGSALKALLRSCVHLEELDVSDCPTLDETSLCDIARASICPKLTQLRCVNSHGITDESLALLVEKAPLLVDVRAQLCKTTLKVFDLLEPFGARLKFLALDPDENDRVAFLQRRAAFQERWSVKIW